MSGLILVFTIFAAMGVGILCGFLVLNLFFYVMGRKQSGSSALAKTVPAV